MAPSTLRYIDSDGHILEPPTALVEYRGSLLSQPFTVATGLGPLHAVLRI